MNESNEIPQKFLPLGTVCRLKEGQKSVMITGYGAINIAEKQIYDYMAVLYPEGQITSDVSLMFNHDKIEKIEFMGYNNEENVEFQKELTDYMANVAPHLLDGIDEKLMEEEAMPKEPAPQTVAEVAASTGTDQLAQPLFNADDINQ